MERMIFVNLPTSNLEISKAFYTGLGFRLNPEFSDDQCACVVISDQIFVMVLTEERFADFVPGEVLRDPRRTEVINCLSATSREEVDELIARALAHGGKPWQDTVADGPMYGGSFADPDGHAWEVMYMEMPG